MSWPACAVVGTLLTFGGNGLVTVAERDVPSGLAALLIASVPLWVIVLRALWGEHPRRADRAGRHRRLRRSRGYSRARAAARGRRPGRLSAGRPRRDVLGQRLVRGQPGAIAQRPVALDGAADAVRRRGDDRGRHPGGRAVGAAARRDLRRRLAGFAFLVFIGSIVAFSAYAWLLRNVAISTVATYAYVNPVIAVVLGAVILSEPVHAATLAGMAIIVASVAFTMRVEGTEHRSRAGRGGAARVSPEMGDRDFRWQDGERLIRFGRGSLADAPDLLGDGYVLLTTERRSPRRPSWPSARPPSTTWRPPGSTTPRVPCATRSRASCWWRWASNT